MTITADVEEIHVRRCGPVEGCVVDRDGSVRAWVTVGGIEFRRCDDCGTLSTALDVVNDGIFKAVQWLADAYHELPEDVREQAVVGGPDTDPRRTG